MEGGGKAATKGEIRRGLRGFLKDISALAREKNTPQPLVIACGSRESTFEAFSIAMRSDPQSFNVLLVDSDAPVNDTPRKHLQKQSRGWKLQGIADEQCHLMVQMMEAWIVADIEALEKYYGQGFKRNSIPRTTDVELIDKVQLMRALKSATRKTQKGEYSKTGHAPDVLQRLDASKVRRAARHCELFFAALEKKVNG
ncbi:MAG: DUF4276 family protein [Acidobacteriota bacterium]